MRTSLDIDDDVLQAAKELARAEKKTAGQVLSELARKGLTQATPGFAEDAAAPPYVMKNGWYVLTGREDVVVTRDWSIASSRRRTRNTLAGRADTSHADYNRH